MSLSGIREDSAGSCASAALMEIARVAAVVRTAARGANTAWPNA